MNELAAKRGSVSVSAHASKTKILQSDLLLSTIELAYITDGWTQFIRASVSIDATLCCSEVCHMAYVLC